MALESAETVVAAESVETPAPTASPAVSTSSPPRRLGLLQCPNAESLGWGSLTPGAEDDGSGSNILSLEELQASGGGASAGVTGINNESTAPKADDTAPAVTVSSAQDAKDKNNSAELLSPSEDTDWNKDRCEVVDEKEDNLSRKRPRLSTTDNNTDFSSKDKAEGSDEELGETQEAMKGGDDGDAEGIMSTEPSTSANPLKPLHLSATLDYESLNKAESEGMRRSQILTIVYNNNVCGGTTEESVSTVVGKISGGANIELVSPTSQGDSMGGPEHLPKEAQPAIITLDVFGYRISQACNNPIVIDRPDWMNALPITIICQNTSQAAGGKSVLRVRITSITNESKGYTPYLSGSNLSSGECYYSAYPEESYQLDILPPNALQPGNYTANGIGVCTILQPWKDTLDKITNVLIKDSVRNESNIGMDCKSKQPASLKNHNRILLCGAKGVGKSTLLRYATNRILSAPASCNNTGTNCPQQQSFRRVAILDLDCGQAELSPPGMLSLTTVSLPLLSDPPIHMVCGGSCDHYGRQIKPSEVDENRSGDVTSATQHEAAYFFGDLTSKADPEIYIHMASQLMERYHELQELEKQRGNSSLPLLVNTDGWVKGLGFEILSAIIGVVNPQHIVQIMGSTKAKSFDMSSHNRGSPIEPRLVHIIPSFDETLLPELDDDNRSRRSMDSGASTGPLSASASDHRNHRLCAYFLGGYHKMTKLRPHIPGENEPISFHKERGLYDPNNIVGITLASMPPYAVPFHSVHLYPPAGLLDSISELRPLWGVRGDMACNDVLDSLNGSVVGLCCKPDAVDATISRCNAGVGIPILNCIGLGIIRSTDYNRKVFFVLTPVHPRLLANVTSFVGGNINLPLQCLYRGVHSDSFPFLSCGHNITNASLGADVMKSRNASRGRK